MSRRFCLLIKRVRNNDDITASGSITVEASFVMPVVILAIFAILYLTFYLHDICRIQATVDLTIHKASLAVKHDSDIATGEIYYEDINSRGVFYLLFGNTEEEEKQVKKLLEQELQQGLFLVKTKNIKVKTDKIKVSASVDTDTSVTLPGLSGLFNLLPDKKIIAESFVHNPAETVRCTEVILETGSSIKGVDELKEKVENILGNGN